MAKNAAASQSQRTTRRFIAELYGVPATKENFFCVSFAPPARHNSRVTGAFLNAFGILLGALFGLAWRPALAARTQHFLKSALAAATAWCGLHLIWQNIGGSAPALAKQLFLALLAILLGRWLGKILRLQKISNRLGRHAAQLLAGAENGRPAKPVAGFAAATILFCAAPLGLIGAVTDGLADDFFPLAVKAVMDGLAMASFVKTFRWPAALAAGPVFFFLGGLTQAAHAFLPALLARPEQISAVNIAGGLIILAMTLVILEIRRVELADFLPALALAPLLAAWFR